MTDDRKPHGTPTGYSSEPPAILQRYTWGRESGAGEAQHIRLTRLSDGAVIRLTQPEDVGVFTAEIHARGHMSECDYIAPYFAAHDHAAHLRAEAFAVMRQADAQPDQQYLGVHLTRPEYAVVILALTDWREKVGAEDHARFNEIIQCFGENLDGWDSLRALTTFARQGK